MGSGPKVDGQKTSRPVAGQSPDTQKTSSEVAKENAVQQNEAFADALRKRGVIVREIGKSAVRVESRRGKLTPEEEAQIDTLPKDKYKATSAYGDIIFEDTDEPTQMLVRAYMELEGLSFDEAVKVIRKEKAEDKVKNEAINVVRTWQKKISDSKNWDKVNKTLMPVAETFEKAVKQYDADRSVDVRDILKQAHPFLTEKQLNLLDQTARARIKDNEQDFFRPYATSDGYGTNKVYMSHKSGGGYANTRSSMMPWTEFVGDFAGVPQ